MSATISSAGARLRESVAPASDVCSVCALSAWLTPRLSSAVNSSRLSRGPAPRVIHSAAIVAAPPLRFRPRALS